MALGYLLAATALGALAPLMQNMIHLKFGWPLLTPGLVLVTVALGLGVTVLAGLLPAISAGRVTPLEALRPSVVGVSYRRMVGASAILGIVLIAIALLVLFTQNVGLLAIGALLFLLGLILIAPALVRPLSLAFGTDALVMPAGNGHPGEATWRQPSRRRLPAPDRRHHRRWADDTSIQGGFLGILKKSLAVITCSSAGDQRLGRTTWR
jgi:putative ABC transport system permease protein